MSSHKALFWFLTLVSPLLCPAMGQPDSQETDELVREIPIALTASETPAETEETVAFLNAAILGSKPRAAIIAIETGLPSWEEKTQQLVEKTEDELKSHLSLTDLDDLKKSLQRQDGVLRGLRDQIRSESERLEESLEQIRTRREIWNLTQETGQTREYPDSVIALIKQTLEALEQGREQIGEKRSHLLSLQNSIVELRSLIQESLNEVTAAEEEILGRLFSFEGPPLWDVSQIKAGRIWPRFRDQLLRNGSSFKDYAATQSQWIFLSGLILLLATLMLRSTRKRLEDGAEDHEGLRGVKLVLEHPFASSITLVFFISAIFHPEAPRSWHNVNLLLGLIALLRLLPAFVPSQLITFSFLLLGLRTLELINSQIPEGSSLGRLLTILILLSSIVSLFRFKSRIRSVQEISRTWSTAHYLASWLGLLVLAIALLSGMSGNLALTSLLAGGTIRTAFLAVSFWLAFSVFCGILALGLRTQTAQRARLIRNNRDLVFRKTTRTVGGVTILLFALSVPYNFSVFDPISSAVVETLTTPLEFQALSFSLADILAFAFLVWLSFQISRLVCFILDEDFLPRFTLPRGVPSTISRLTYYAILLLGFVIALAAAGLDLGRITILAGAFGVGIGFGLQNIVNNFVSGLILLFERPVHVGDKIQLAQDLTGEVIRIGIRASVVRTFEGAEVLVPNGQLISDALTNWTLSDSKRRMTIPVGVAYGTNPQKVIDILKDLASAHSEVLKDPGPIAFFMGFGESSLDFSLRVWVANFESGFQVRSDLAVAINAALEEAGIEIPFPQRDLHIRSVTGDLKLQEGNEPPADGDEQHHLGERGE